MTLFQYAQNMIKINLIHEIELHGIEPVYLQDDHLTRLLYKQQLSSHQCYSLFPAKNECSIQLLYVELIWSKSYQFF